MNTKNRPILLFVFFGFLVLNCISSEININDKEINYDYVPLASGNSAPLKHLWNRTQIYSSSNDIALDSAGNIFISGYQTSYGRLYKYNKDGSLKWSTHFPYASNSGMFTVAVDSNDDIYVGGTQWGSSVPENTLLVKYNNLGALIWYTPPLDEPYAPPIGDPWGEGVLSSMTIDSMDNIYVGGTTNLFYLGIRESLLLKYNTSGTLKWARTWNGDAIRDLEVDSLGNIYAISGSGDFTKWNSSGDLIWQQNYYDGKRNSLEVDTLNNIYIRGKQTLRQYNSSGNLQWTILLPEDTWYDGLTLDSLGDIYIRGADSGRLIITKYDKYGNYLWNWTWGSNFVITQNLDIIFDAEGNLLISCNMIIDNKDYRGLFKFEALLQIAIYSPKSGDYFGEVPPGFDISILKADNSTIWYTLNSGIKNYISTYRGEINHTEWSKIGEGLVNLTFCAINSSGFKAYSEVLIFKDLTAPTSFIYYMQHKEPNIVNQSTYFRINASDNSGAGISTIQYKINDSDWIEYNGIFNLNNFKSGDYIISYRAIDTVGNVEDANIISVRLVRIKNNAIESYNILILLTIISVFLIISSIKQIKKLFEVK